MTTFLHLNIKFWKYLPQTSRLWVVEQQKSFAKNSKDKTFYSMNNGKGNGNEEDKDDDDDVDDDDDDERAQTADRSWRTSVAPLFGVRCICVGN